MSKHPLRHVSILLCACASLTSHAEARAKKPLPKSTGSFEQEWESASGEGVVAGVPDAAIIHVSVAGPGDPDDVTAKAKLRMLVPRALERIKEAVGAEPAYETWTEGKLPAFDPQHGGYPGAPYMATLSSSFRMTDLAEADRIVLSVRTDFGPSAWRDGRLGMHVRYHVDRQRSDLDRAHREALEDATRRAASYAEQRGRVLKGEGLPGPFTDGADRTSAGWVITSSVNVIWQTEPAASSPSGGG